MKEIFKVLTGAFGGATITSLCVTHSINWMFYAPVFIVSIVLFIYYANKHSNIN
jgi:hypothetical protein